MTHFLSRTEIEKLLETENDNTSNPISSTVEEFRIQSLKSFLKKSDLTEKEKNLFLKKNLNNQEIQTLKEILLKSKSKTFGEELPQDLVGKQRMTKSKYELVLQTVIQKKLQNAEIDINNIFIELGIKGIYVSYFFS